MTLKTLRSIPFWLRIGALDPLALVGPERTEGRDSL